MYHDKKVLVLGFARSGYDVAKLLSNYNNKITINDFSSEDKSNPEHIKELKDKGIEFIFGYHPEDILDWGFDLIVKNPGISDENVVIKEAIKRDILVTTELDVAFTFFPKGVKTIAITGSNGKTTTTEIIYQTLKKANQQVILAGNIGIATSGIVNDLKNDSIVVMEVSVQQLNNMKYLKPDIIVFTNLSPTHLDIYKTYEKYQEIKLRIFNNNDQNSVSIINYDDELLKNKTKNIKGIMKYYSVKEKVDSYFKDDQLYLNEKSILDTKNILIKGNHNYENILSVILVMEELDINLDYLKDFLSEFKGYSHRLEFIKEINSRKFYNDSKSTNMKALEIALKAFNENIVLLIGGQEREQDFNEVLRYMNKVRYIVAFGEVRKRALDFFRNEGFSILETEYLRDAVSIAYEKSKENEIILLSPGSGSWDFYKKFEDRGDEFRNLVEKLGEENEN